MTLTYEELQALPQTEASVDIRCVTRWSRFDTSFRGVHWRELAKLVRPKPSAHFVVAHAEQGFTSHVPLETLEDDEALIVWPTDAARTGARLASLPRGALALLLEEREMATRPSSSTPTDQPGFCERYRYHNDADCWQEQRYGF